MYSFKKGDSYLIIKYKYNGLTFYKQNLLTLGLVPGVIVFVKRVAPFGDPVELFFSGQTLSLRRSELNIIDVKRISC